MQHLLIGGYVIGVILGAVSFHQLSLSSKLYKHSYLKTYGLHILALNLIVISMTVTRYFKVNILSGARGFGSISPGTIGDGLFIFRKGVEYFGIIAVSFFLVKILYQIQKKALNKLIRNIYIPMMILSAFAFGTGLTAFLINKDESWLRLFCTIIWGGVILFVIVVFALKFFVKRASVYEKDPALLLFLYFYLIILSLFFVQNLFNYSGKNLVMMIFVWFMNLFPFYWSKYKLQMENSNGFALNIHRENIENLISEYSITGREQEILECILRGFSNREIQKHYFLSPHTVKNHNHNLYKKLGVRNRIELMKKVFEYVNSN